MPGLHLYQSNRLEELADALAELIRTPLPSPLQPEIVTVQSLGMRRWLSLELAARNRVTMNVEFPFPATLVQRAFRAAFPELPREDVFARELLPWRILALLPELLPRAGFEELARYLRGEMRPLKEYQLATRLGAVFDRYLAYRPELLLEWQGGHDSSWQAVLWRELSRGREAAPALARRLSHGLRDDAPGSATQSEPAFAPLDSRRSLLIAFPPRISIFGISSLPPFYISLLGEIASVLEVHLFQLEPTPEYWGDLKSRREQDRILKRHRKRALSAEDLHLEEGHPLLASMGKTSRDFSETILTLEPVREHERFVEPTGETLLARLQADIFHLRGDGARRTIRPDDRSIQIHCCHSPTRELEVLHDQLLALFERDPQLTPRDILVTMPDVDKYAPFIEAVFGTAEGRSREIPFKIADRSARAESCLADTFLELLDLTTSRFGAASVLALLESRPVRGRFEIAEADLDTIRNWIDRTAIRWGIDGAHRTTFDLPAFEDNTWRAGLRRLLLGYALPGDSGTLFEGLLPVREIEGNLAMMLGRFVDFADALFELTAELREPRTLREWERTLRRMLTTFFEEGEESADQIRHLREAFTFLGRAQREAHFEASVPFEVLRAHLAQHLEESSSGTGFLGGAVTFCALKPMRSIPFKVLCLIGLDDTAFPRHATALAFDLVAQKPRLGDRSLRDDDRQLFLESILSVRGTLYLSYSGLSIRNNAESPPSVLVTELLDYLDANFELAEGNLRDDLLVTRHRLQPFSAEYFRKESRLFSYSEENARAARQCAQPRDGAPAFTAEPLPPPESEWRELDWERLAEFCANPARFFARERLGLRVPREATPLAEREPQELEPLDRYGFEQTLIRRALAGEEVREQLAATRASGQLPPGYAGDSQFHTMCGRIGTLATTIREHISTAPLPPLSVDLTLGDVRLHGTLHGLYPEGLLRHRAAALKAKDLLRAWVAHLVLQATAPPGAPRATLLFGLEAAWRFPSLEDAPARLADLLALFTRGLQTPLPFFPESSLDYARRTLQAAKGETADPLAAARGKWEGNQRQRGEKEDAWLDLCFGRVANPFDAAWREIAQRIYAPLLACRMEVRT